MKTTWVSIPEVLFFQEGPGVRNTQYTANGVKLLNVANLVDSKIDLSTSDRYISEEEAYGKYKHFLCDAGDFVIASSGIKVEYIDKKMGFVDASMLPLCMNTSTIRFKVLDKNKLRIRYFMYYLKSQHFKGQLFRQITGSAQLNYGPSHLKKMVIPLISLDEQDEIIACMDRVQNTIALRQQELTYLDDLVKARFVELTESVNTVATRMGDIATYINGYAFKPTDWTESGLPIIRIQNLNDVNAKYNYFDGKIDSKYLVTTGDVLVSWATHLEAYIWDGDSAWLNQHIFKALFDKMPINKLYFVYATEDALRQAFKNAHGFKPTMEHIKRRDFENAIVKLPDMEIQNQFADFVARTNKSKAAVQKSLDETQVLFDSLMQKYFG